MDEKDLNRAESLRQNRSGDLDFYVRLALAADPPVLELGVGSGRVMSALARAGVRVVGLDLARAPLTLASVRMAALPHAAVVQADMCQPPFRGGFGLVLIPFRGLLELRERREQAAALAAAHAILSPGGRLALDVLNPGVAGALARAFGAEQAPRRQHVSTSPDGPMLRLVYRDEMEAMLEGAGFSIDALYGDFDGTPFHEGATEMIWVARRLA